MKRRWNFQVRNIVNRDLALKLGPLNTREMNHLDKDTQIQLRKKAYNFQAADKKMDEVKPLTLLQLFKSTRITHRAQKCSPIYRFLNYEKVKNCLWKHNLPTQRRQKLTIPVSNQNMGHDPDNSGFLLHN